jgi:hypothetical protein
VRIFLLFNWDNRAFELVVNTSEGIAAVIIMNVSISDDDLDSGIILALTLRNKLVLAVVTSTENLVGSSKDDNVRATSLNLDGLIATTSTR